MRRRREEEEDDDEALPPFLVLEVLLAIGDGEKVARFLATTWQMSLRRAITSRCLCPAGGAKKASWRAIGLHSPQKQDQTSAVAAAPIGLDPPQTAKTEQWRGPAWPKWVTLARAPCVDAEATTSRSVSTQRATQITFNS